jgi:DNA ligase (NAD+)
VSERVAELRDRIREAREAYYNGSPTLSDAAFDALVDELSEAEADDDILTAVGAPPPVSEWKKAKHSIPMGSLDKVNTLAQMSAWALASGPPGEPLFVTEKLDGISIHLKYERGKFTQAVTRGDGYVGEDITSNVAKMKGVPVRLPAKFTGSFRGEILLLRSDHKAWFAEYANPRNAASGIAKRYDGKGNEHLSVYVYRVADSDQDFASEAEQFAFLASMGFQTPNHYLSALTPGVKTPHDFWVEYQQGKRDALDYDIDGLVVAVNDLAKQMALGEKDLRPKGAVAFKFAPLARETVIRSIAWQTGATGRMTPVATFDPVNLLGAQVVNASLYNLKYIRDLGLGPGARVLVARANDVIPRVTETIVRVDPDTPPSVCTTCGASTEIDGEYLVCADRAGCPAQAVGRIVQWVKALDVLDFGDGLIEKLVVAGRVKTVPDLYRLTVADVAGLDRLGEKTATKVLANLAAKSPVPLELFLGALSIPGVATSTVKMIIADGLDTFESIWEAPLERLAAVPGLGPIKAASLRAFFAANVSLLNDLASVVPIAARVRGALTGSSFCFTGSMQRKRAELESMASKAGGEVKASVTKGLTYLVMADASSTSSKAQAARKNGTKVLSEEDFVALCGAP